MKLTIRKDAYYIFWFYVWNVNTIVAYIRAIMVRIPFIGSYVFIIFNAIYLLLWVCAFPRIRKYVRTKEILLYVLFIIYYLFSFIWNDGVRMYLWNNAFQILIICFPMIFLGVSFEEEKNEIYSMMKITSIMSIFLHILMIVFLGTNTLSQVEDNMEYAYRILPHVCLVFMVYFNEKNKAYLLAGVLGVIQIIFFGSRGASLLIFVFLATYLLFFLGKKRFLLKAVTILGGVLVALNLENILLWASSVFLSKGWNVRIFTEILNGRFFSSKGRDLIRENCIRFILQKPFTGYGVAGDRLLDNMYAHNIILEMFISYGVIVGSVILIGIAILVIKTLIKTKDTNSRTIVLALIFGNGLLKLMLSSSYLLEYQFYLLIGICISLNRINRKMEIYTHEEESVNYNL